MIFIATKIRAGIITILLLFLSTKKVAAQKDIFNKNAIYTTVGTAGLYFSATGYYERIIKQKMWHKNISSFIKVGYGAEGHYGGGSTYLFGQYGILTGVKTHHLEISAGPLFFISGDDLDIPVASTLGWRIQKPGSNFLFRMGVGVPEAIYLGAGFSF